MEQSSPSYLSCENTQLTNAEMLSVYGKLSITDNFDFDLSNNLEFVQHCIEELFTSKFRLMNSEEIQGNSMLLNKCFVELLKYCDKKAKFKRVGFIFLEFCNYFDLDSVIVYRELHEKIQALIRNSAQCMCGAKEFRRQERKYRKYPEIHVTTLFDICRD